jgi:RecA-family ATPase
MMNIQPQTLADNGKLFNREAERAVLGAMLRDNTLIPAALEIITLDDFSTDAHRRVARSIWSLHNEGEPVDLVTLYESLHRTGQSGDVGSDYIAELWDAAPAPCNMARYAQIVRDKSRARRLLFIGQRLTHDAADGIAPVADLLARTRDDLQALESDSPENSPVEQFTIGQLQDRYPRLYPPLIDGVLREQETANIISVSKIGKSWLAYGMLLCIVTGRPWLDRFATSRGKVLLIDNELHKPTIAYRIRTVAEALSIAPAEYENDLHVWPLRGNLQDIFGLAEPFRVVTPGTYKLVVLDAMYRMLPPDASENDNAAMARFFNQLDAYAAQIGSAFVNVHHSSKGSQSEKRVTDVGAGAGAQSRAADAHLVLREHEEPDVIVLEAAVRSFKPVDPLALRWSFPLWTPADDIDPAKLRGRQTAAEQRQNERDREGMESIRERLRKGAATIRDLRDLGIGKERLTRLLGKLEDANEVAWKPLVIRGNETREYWLTTHVGDDVGDSPT